MKQKMVMCLLAGVLVLGIGGCGAQEVEVPEVENVETAEEEPVPEETAEEEGDEQEKTDAEDQLKEVPTVDDAAESGKTEPEETEPEETEAASASVVYEDASQITLDPSWTYADHSKINSGAAVLYKAAENRKEIVVGVNAGHGTSGGTKVKTLCHPDGSAKVTGGTTAAGATEAVAVSSGMTFNDGTPESSVTLRMAQILKEKLLAAGYDVLMLRDGDDVQLDNVARTVICNNAADCHIALHWDGDGLNYDKGCFYISVPDGLKSMEPVASHWSEHNALGSALVEGLRAQGAKINGGGSMSIDLTQTSYSTIPSVDMELGNACSDHSDSVLDLLGNGLVQGVNSYFGQS
ncbi:N-acetylmuramoyl-L-alanine amidase [Clostridiaceae bacterium Marseille-Q4143]|nr:N-acetylmuramoyl-L-alanine amidase [Clostridiaceae bacterium Marseille-Q4143]